MARKARMAPASFMAQSSCQIAFQHDQRRLRRGDFDPPPFPAEQIFSADRFLAVCQGDKYRPHRFRIATAGWTGNARCGDAEIGVSQPPDSLRHQPGGGFADRAVFPDGCFRDAEQFRLGKVAVSDRAPLQKDRTSGDIRQTVGDQSSRAGFRHGQGELSLRQQRRYRAFQGFLIGGEDVVAQPLHPPELRRFSGAPEPRRPLPS